MNKLMVFIILIVGFFCLFRYYVVSAAIKHGGELVDFKSMKLPTTPNYYMLCPSNFCIKGNHEDSPVFNVPVDTLETLWSDIVKRQPRVSLLANDIEGRQQVYVQCSWFWHFPDFINVQFIPLGEHTSSLAIYSHSRFGYSDLGVNQQRVQGWLAQLSAH